MNDFTHDARVRKEANTLIEAGHRVHLYALLSRKSLSYENCGPFKVFHVRVMLRYLLPRGPLFFFIKYIEYIFQTLRILWSVPYDVYHAHDLETLPICAILAGVHKRPLVYDSHELYIDMEKHTRVAYYFWYLIEKILTKTTDINILTTKTRATLFSQRYRVPFPEIIMNCQPYQEIGQSGYLREKLSISRQTKIMIYQGQVAEARGVDTLLDVMNHLEGVALVVIGRGDYRDRLRKKMTEHAKRDFLFLIEPVPWEELKYITASADLGISLLRNVNLNNYYALSNKLFEYCSAGLPVVFSNFPEMRRVILDNHIGFVVDEAGNPEDIARVIQKILNNKALYKKMSSNAKRLVKEKYNWEIEAGKLIRIYKKISIKKLNRF